jgi:hypothetical protein
LEAEIQRKVVLFARSLKVLAQKMSFGSGWPDYLFLYRGAVLFIEFKAPKEKPSKIQQHIIDKFRTMGFWVEVVDNVVIGKDTIRRFIDDTDSRRQLEGLRGGNGQDQRA